MPNSGVGIVDIFGFFPHIREVVRAGSVPLGEESEICSCETTVPPDAHDMRVLGDIRDRCHVWGRDEKVSRDGIPVLVAILLVNIHALQPGDLIAEGSSQFVGSETVCSTES